MEQQIDTQNAVYASSGQAYNYYAFISYSRRDEQWARWLQKKMEQYRLPTVLRKEENTLPKKIHPVFRDKTDLTTGQLQTALHNELDTSKKLIAICSPTSARSEWVNKEVQRFIDRGRAHDIIPFIVEGIPNCGHEAECFPPALRLPEEEQILGVSVPELGKGDAFLRTVAGLLDIKFDQLKRRHEQRRKRNNLITAVCSILFLALAGFAGFRMWDYYVPHEAYYTDYVLRWGVPEGINKLTKKEISAREGHYVLVTERGLIRKLIFANSVGTPMEHLEPEMVDRPMIALFYYTDDGQISHVEYIDNNGKVLSTQVYTTDLKAVDFQISSSDSALQTLAASTTNIATGMFDLVLAEFSADRSDISRYLLEYDENGFVTKKVYYRDRRTPILDADGIGGLEYVLDSLGRPVEIRYLGLNGEGYTSTKKNVAGKRFFYDDEGNWSRIEYFDSQGKLCFNESGWMVCLFEFDENGNNTIRAYVDANGDIAPSNLGYAYSLFSYDEQGFFVCAEYFDMFGNRASHRNASAIIWKEYDNNGRIIRQSYYDTSGNPTLTPAGVSVQVYTYDERGNYAGGVNLGTNDKPIVNSNGYAYLSIEWDERGNHAAESFFGVDGKPVLNYEGIAAYRSEFDEHNNLTFQRYYGIDGQLTLHINGYAIRKNVFDDRWNPVSMYFYGTDEKPILCMDGYASVDYAFNEGGNIVGHRYFGVNREPVLNNRGFAALASEYNENGSPTILRMLGIDGKPINCVDGYAAMMGQYDERGRLKLLSFLDENDKPVLVFGGWAAIGFELDGRGNITSTTYYGVDGKPTMSDEGYASIVFKYDVQGNLIGASYLDADGVVIKEL